MAENEQQSERTWPSIEVAYPLAISSYDMAIKRFDAMDTKLNTLITFAVTVTLAVPAIANTKGLAFRSVWLVIAVCAFLAGVAVVTYARVAAELILLNPKTLYEHYLESEELEFKRYMIYWAGENFVHNTNVINRNARLAALASILFALEAVAVGAWVVSAYPW
jgi:hypothetical protein